MKRTDFRRWRIAVALLLLPVALTACSLGLPTLPTPVPTTAQPTASAAPTLGHDSCVTGSWVASAAEMKRFVEALVIDSQYGPTKPLSVTATGTMAVDLKADGTFSYRPDAAITLEYAIGGQETGALSGEATGTWVTIGDLIEANTLTFARLTSTLGTQTFDLSGNGDGWDVVPFRSSHYTCDKGLLKLSVTLNFSAPVSLTLTPAS